MLKFQLNYQSKIDWDDIYIITGEIFLGIIVSLWGINLSNQLNYEWTKALPHILHMNYEGSFSNSISHELPFELGPYHLYVL